MLLAVIAVSPASISAEENPVPNEIKWIVKPVMNYDGLREFHDGLARVSKLVNGKSKFGYIDKNGREVVPVVYDGASDFSEGLAAVGKNNKWGFIDKDGKIVIPLMYNKVESFSHGLAWVNKNGKWGFIDKNGKTVLPFEYTLGPSSDATLQHISDNLVRVVKSSDGSEGLFDLSKRKLLFTADRIMNLSDNLIMVQKNDKFGFIDPTGKIVLPIQYAYVEDFHEGLAAVGKKDPKSRAIKYGYMNKSGKIVIPYQYQSAGIFSDGVAVVRVRFDSSTYKATLRIIDKNGKNILGKDISDYFNIGPFVNGTAVVDKFAHDQHKLGLIDKSGKLVLPVEYDSILDYESFINGKPVPYPHGIKFIVKDEMTGLTDPKGKIVLQPSYLSISVITDKVLDVTDGQGISRLADIETGAYLGDTAFHGDRYTPVIVSEFAEGPLISVETIEGQRIALNEAGQQMLPLADDEMNAFEPFYASEGVIAVLQNGKWGIIANPFVQTDRPSAPQRSQ
jgi:hypothetical protein